MKAIQPGPTFVPTQEDLQQYRKLRVASRDLNRRLVKAIPTEVLHEVGAHLGVRRADGVFELPSEEAVNVLMDACIYGWLVEGKTVLEAFRLRQAKTGKPRISKLKQQILEASAAAYHGVLQIKETVAGFGVYVQDGFTGASFFLMDERLSHHAGAVGCWFTARLVTYGPWKMTTGAMLTLGALSERRSKSMLRVVWGEADAHGLEPEDARMFVALAFTTLGLEYLAGAEAPAH